MYLFINERICRANLAAAIQGYNKLNVFTVCRGGKYYKYYHVSPLEHA